WARADGPGTTPGTPTKLSPSPIRPSAHTSRQWPAGSRLVLTHASCRCAMRTASTTASVMVPIPTTTTKNAASTMPSTPAAVLGVPCGAPVITKIAGVEQAVQPHPDHQGQCEQARTAPAVASSGAEDAGEAGARHVSAGDRAERAMQRHAEHTAHRGHGRPVRVAEDVKQIFQHGEAEADGGAVDDAVHRLVEVAPPQRHPRGQRH